MNKQGKILKAKIFGTLAVIGVIAGGVSYTINDNLLYLACEVVCIIGCIINLDDYLELRYEE